MQTIPDGALRLPVQVEQVTAHWLSEALAFDYPGIKVTSARIDNVLWGTGTKVPVSVKYNRVRREAGLPRNLIVKGGFSEHRQLMERCYELEVRFYRDLLPMLGINVPQAYFAASDSANHQQVTAGLLFGATSGL